ncbi:hypothetical protein [Streptomyces sp. NPDC018584]|uniref:hypothetical protein n=1 Tax=unclassified Streptomyces TaxID=2593676 RepID=UPI0037BD253D
MLTLAAKLTHLLKRRPTPDGELPSNRTLAREISELPGYTRGGSVGALSKLRTGTDTNPTVTTIEQLAAVLNAPEPFLLPGWDDVLALTIFKHNQTARDVVRHLDALPQSELEAVLNHLKERRELLGLPPTVPPEQIETEHDSGDANRRHRRRRSVEDAMKYAADSLEGLRAN